MAQFYRHINIYYSIRIRMELEKRDFENVMMINKEINDNSGACILWYTPEPKFVVGKWTQYLSHSPRMYPLLSHYYLVALECIQVHFMQWLTLTPSNSQVYEQTNEIKTHKTLRVETIVFANCTYAAAVSNRVQ